MTDLPEQHSPKAARILAAASELLLSRGAKGVTIADVAQKAYVGKGTVYLYYATKEDLLLGLIGREFLAAADHLIDELAERPEIARPARFCPAVLRFVTQRPLIAALQNHNDDLLGMLADHPRSAALHNALGPSALLFAVLPAWRRNGLARTDWEVADQALALHILTTGAAITMSDPRQQLTSADPERVFAAAVTALLGPEVATDDQVRATALEIADFLGAGRSAVVRIISAQVGTHS